MRQKNVCKLSLHANAPDVTVTIFTRLREELIAVISKYTKVAPEDIKVSLDKQGNLEVLDVNVILPDVELRC